MTIHSIIKNKALQLLVLFLLFYRAAYALNPSPSYYYTPDSLRLHYKQVYLHSDTFILNAWQILPLRGSKDQNCTIIVANGDAGNMSSSLFMAKCLADKGYTVFLFDYRGFGHSSPFPVNRKMLYYNEYSNDLDAAIRWNRENTGGKVGVLGLSMGSLICLRSMERTPVDFFIAESLLYDPFAVSDYIRRVKHDEIILPVGAKPYLSFLEDIKIKVGIISGRRDKLCPVKPLSKLEHKNHNISLVLHKGGHLEGLYYLSSTKRYMGDVYANEINSIISGK